MRTIREIMQSEPIVVQPQDSVHHALELLIEHSISGLPVTDADDHIVGVVSERDVLKLFYEPDGRRDGREQASPWSLYDVEDDPEERRDRLAGEPDAEAKRVFEQLRNALREAADDVRAPERRTAPVDPELAERLRDLGYVEE